MRFRQFSAIDNLMLVQKILRFRTVLLDYYVIQNCSLKNNTINIYLVLLFYCSVS